MIPNEVSESRYHVLLQEPYKAAYIKETYLNHKFLAAKRSSRSQNLWTLTYQLTEEDEKKLFDLFSTDEKIISITKLSDQTGKVTQSKGTRSKTKVSPSNKN